MKPNNKQLMYDEYPDAIDPLYAVNEESKDFIDRKLCYHILFVRKILQQIYWKTKNEIK